MSLSKKVFAGGSWTAASTGILAIVQLVQLIVLARILSPGDFGVVAIIVMAQGFVEMLMIAGISNAIIQRQDATDDELSSLHWVNTLLGLLLGAAIVLLAPVVGMFFNNPVAVLPVAILGLAVPISAQSHVSRACLERDLNFRTVATTEILAGIVTVLAVIACTVAWGIIGVSIGIVIGFAARALLFLKAGRRVFRIRAHLKFGETRRFLDFGIFQFLNSLVGFVDGNTATILIGRSLTPVDLGGYNLAYNASVNVPGKLNPAITRVMFPALSRVQADPPRFSEAVLKLITLTGIVNTPLMLALGLVAPAFVPTIFGDKWGWATSLVQILAVCGLLRALVNPMGVVLMARNRQRLGLAINIGKTTLSILVMATAIQIGGVTGAAVALAVSGVISLVINHFLLRHLLDARFGMIVWAHAMPLLAAVPAALLGGTAMYFLAPILSSWGVIVLVGGLIVTTYALTVWLMRVPVVMQLLGAANSWIRGRRAQDGSN